MVGMIRFPPYLSLPALVAFSTRTSTVTQAISVSLLYSKFSLDGLKGQHDELLTDLLTELRVTGAFYVSYTSDYSFNDIISSYLCYN